MLAIYRRALAPRQAARRTGPQSRPARGQPRRRLSQPRRTRGSMRWWAVAPVDGEAARVPARPWLGG